MTRSIFTIVALGGPLSLGAAALAQQVRPAERADILRKLSEYESQFNTVCIDARSREWLLQFRQGGELSDSTNPDLVEQKRLCRSGTRQRAVSRLVSVRNELSGGVIGNAEEAVDGTTHYSLPDHPSIREVFISRDTRLHNSRLSDVVIGIWGVPISQRLSDAGNAARVERGQDGRSVMLILPGGGANPFRVRLDATTGLPLSWESTSKFGFTTRVTTTYADVDGPGLPTRVTVDLVSDAQLRVRRVIDEFTYDFSVPDEQDLSIALKPKMKVRDHRSDSLAIVQEDGTLEPVPLHLQTGSSISNRQKIIRFVTVGIALLLAVAYRVVIRPRLASRAHAG